MWAAEAAVAPCHVSRIGRYGWVVVAPEDNLPRSKASNAVFFVLKIHSKQIYFINVVPSYFSPH
jgi:hypothetical protein